MYEDGREGWEPTDAASDHFLMFGYKILTCPRRYSHDWISCPYAHSGESARRREPHLYKPIPCPESKGGQPCPRGESCKYAHNDFEYWLHPSRFKTEICKQGPGCSRKVCFFAHQPHEIRKPGDSFAGEHFLTAAFGKHGKKHGLKVNPFEPPVDYMSATPLGMAAARMKKKAHLQARAEMQLEEALHQLRLPQGPPTCVSPRLLGGQQDSWILPALDGVGYQSSDSLANLHAVLDAPCGTPPVHLMGRGGVDGTPLNAWRSPSPQLPPLGFQDGTSRFVPNVSIGASLRAPDSSPLLFAGSPVGPQTPTNNHQMLELGLAGGLESGRLSSPFGLDEGSPVVHMRDISRLTGHNRLGSPSGGFSSPGLSSTGLSSPGLGSPGLGSPTASRSLWAARSGVQDSARMMSHGSLGLGGLNKVAGTNACSAGAGYLNVAQSWNVGDSPKLHVENTNPLGYIQTTAGGIDIPSL